MVALLATCGNFPWLPLHQPLLNFVAFIKGFYFERVLATIAGQMRLVAVKCI